MDDREQKVSDLLHEAGETHHAVFRIVDGDDADWASWYSVMVPSGVIFPTVPAFDSVNHTLPSGPAVIP